MTTSEYYQNFNNIFAHSSVPWQQKILKRFLIKAGTNNSSLVADIGSGIGNNIKTISGFTEHITAIELSPMALDILRKKYSALVSDLSAINADATTLPLREKMFDIVILTEILEHCENPEKVLAECTRILKPNGSLIVSTPNYLNLAGLWKKIWDATHKNSTWDAWGNHNEGIENFFISTKIKKLLKSQQIKTIEEVGGDILRSWLPFLKRHYNFIDRHPFLRIGRLWPVKYVMMNYFILGKKVN